MSEPPAIPPAAASVEDERISWTAKWGKERFVLSDMDPTMTTIGDLKRLLEQKTNILVKRQKLIGLVMASGPPRQQQQQQNKLLSDDTLLTQVACKRKDNSFLLMGTPEDKIFVDPSEQTNKPEVIDDFDLDFNAGSEEWVQHVANDTNLKKFTEQTQIHMMNDPRDGKPLMVLDLDHTLLDFSSKSLLQSSTTTQSARDIANAMKRPHMDEFLACVYPHYDLVVWSQTSWRWLETKLTELGMLTHPGYNFCFVLDKTSMFQVVSTKRGSSEKFQHQVKPLALIWNKFPNRWNATNTVHLDDLRRNFALNLESGLKVTPYHRKKSKARRDTELMGLSRYLVQLAESHASTKRLDFSVVNFEQWQDVVAGQTKLEDTIDESNKKQRHT